MPLIRYICTKCANSFTSFQGKAVSSEVPCKKCGERSTRTLSAPSSASKITIDNGVQPRAVEVNPDIMELRKDWSKLPNRGD